jgi:hypothetical protein
MAGGVLGLLGAGAAMGMAMWRRRTGSTPDGTE